MLALVAVIASDSLTITSASSDKHQVISAGAGGHHQRQQRSRSRPLDSIAPMSVAVNTITMHDKHEATTAAMKTTITSFQQVLGWR